jgi:sulfoxide reductase catalytic subunit YedY
VHIRRRASWQIPERDASPESLSLDRRRFLSAAGLLGLGVLGGALPAAKATARDAPEPGAVPSDIARLYPARRSAKPVIDRPLSKEEIVATYNNYYEFGDTKDSPAHAAQRLTTRPWQIEITGLVAKPFTLDRDDLVRRMRSRIEERLYRHRCVEAWSIAVPWTGFPLRALVELARPLSSARYLRTVSFRRPLEAPDELKPWYPFPYFEGLRLDEAVHELAFVAIGAYGHELPKQNGLPIGLRIPWKYGYKSPKAIVRFEFTEEQPQTFWRAQAPVEYGFLSNVNPAVPHPRWSQATERFFGPNGVEKRPTLPYNGYAAEVAGMYDDASRKVRS